MTKNPLGAKFFGMLIGTMYINLTFVGAVSLPRISVRGMDGVPFGKEPYEVLQKEKAKALNEEE